MLVKTSTFVANILIWPIILTSILFGELVYAGINTVFIVLVNIFYAVYLKNKRFLVWANFSLLLVGITSLIVFFHGGLFNTGHLWSIFLLLLAYEFKDRKTANKIILTYFGLQILIYGILYGLGYNLEYLTPVFMAVYFFIMVTVGFFLYLYELRKNYSGKQTLLAKEKYEALFNNLSLGVVMIDRNYNILEANRVIKEWFPHIGATEAEFCYEAFHPENNGKICSNCPVMKCFETGQRQTILQKNSTPQGDRIYHLVTNPMIDENNHVYAVIETFEDVTEQKKNELEIQKQEETFRSLVSSLSDMVFTLDAELRHTGLYGNWLDSSGVNPETFLGKTATEVMGDKAGKMHEEAHARALKGEKVVYEWCLHAGQTCTHYQTALSPMRDRQNRVYGIVGVGRDITKLKLSENQIRYQNEFFQLVSDISGNFVSANAANIDERIDRMLASCGAFLQVDRMFLFQFTPDLSLMSNTHEWCAEGIEPVKDSLQNYPVNDVPLISDMINNREILSVPDVDMLSDEYQTEKYELKRQGIQSLFCIPVVKNTRVVGYIGFDAVVQKKTLEKELIRLLSVLANILGDALMKAEAERALEEINHRYHQLAAQSRTVTWEIDKNGRYTYISPVVKQVLGYDPEEVIGKMHFWDFFPDENAASSRDEIILQMDQMQSFTNFMNILQCKDGKLLHVSTNALPVLDENNILTGYKGHDRNVTHQKELEEQILYHSQMQEMATEISALFVSANNYNIDEKIVKSLQIVVEFFNVSRGFIYRFKPNGKHYKLVYEWCAFHVKPTPDTIRQETFFSDFPWWFDQITNNNTVIIHDTELMPDAAKKEKAVLKQMDVKSLVSFPVYDGDKITGFVGFDCTHKMVNWTSEQIAVMKVVASILSDAMEKNKAELALLESERINRETAARFKTYIDASNTGAWEYSRKNGFLWCSPQYFSMLGHDINDYDFSGKPNAETIWSQLIHPDDKENVLKYLASYLDNPKGTYQQIFRMLHRNGHFVWVLSRGKILTDEYGNRSDVFVGTHIDITEQKNSEETIIRKNKELESYLYVASHDLRSPLVNIQGFSNRIQRNIEKLEPLLFTHPENEEDREQAKEIIRKVLPRALWFIQSGVNKMDGLIKGLLMISRTGKMKIHARNVDMNALVEKVISSFNFQLQEMHASVTIDDLPECFGDVVLINQLFSNLVDNAIKYSHKDIPLSIHISGQKNPDSVVYKVADNGIGLDETNVQKIWNVFYRVDPERETEGEGIGLNIVAKIAENHKGSVWVESNPGKGSTFFVKLQGSKAESI